MIATHSSPFLLSIQVSRPLNPSSISLMLWDSLVPWCFSSLNAYFSGKIMHLNWKFLMPPTCMTWIQVSQLYFFSCLDLCWWGLWACYVKCSLKTIGFQNVRGACWKCRASAPPQMDWVTIHVSQDCSWLSRTLQTTDVWCSAYRLNHQRLIVTQHFQSLLSILLYHHWCNFTELCWVSFLLIMRPMTNNPWFCRNLKSVCFHWLFPEIVLAC